MQAIILAAGLGNRIKAVSDGLPKSYLKLNGETLIQRNVRLLRENGINDIVIVTGNQRERFMKDLQAEGVTFAFNPFFKTTNVLASYWCGAKYLTEDVLYLHADTVFHEDVLKGLIPREGDIVLACDTKVCEEEEMKYTLNDGAIDRLNKTMNPKEAEGEFLGVCKISKEILSSVFDVAEKILAQEEFQAFFEVAIQRMIDENQITAQVYDIGDLPWCEIDFPEDYENAKNLLSS